MAGFFGMFDYTKPGKGVSKEDVDKHGIALYFDILARRIGKLVLLNILYLIFSIPAILVYWFASGYIITVIAGSYNLNMAPEMLQLVNMFVTTSLLLLLGSGSASAAMSYVLRKYANDTHAWVWSDFWDSFKDNFVQGTVAFVINTVVFVLCCIAIIFYSWMSGILSVILPVFVGVILVIFFMMQMYVYQIMSSVRLKIKDIYRNALLFTIAKLPINVVSFAAAVGAVYLYSLIAHRIFAFVVVLLIFYTLPVFTQIFITNNAVNKHLVEPAEGKEETEE